MPSGDRSASGARSSRSGSFTGLSGVNSAAALATVVGVFVEVPVMLLPVANQSLIPKAFQEFDEAGRRRPSPLDDRIVGVVEDLMKLTLPTRDRAAYLVDRYSGRKESAPALMKRANLSATT